MNRFNDRRMVKIPSSSCIQPPVFPFVRQRPVVSSTHSTAPGVRMISFILYGTFLMNKQAMKCNGPVGLFSIGHLGALQS